MAEEVVAARITERKKKLVAREREAIGIEREIAGQRVGDREEKKMKRERERL